MLKQVEAVRSLGHHVTVEVPQLFPAPPGPVPDLVDQSIAALATQSLRGMYSSEGDVTYVPIPVPSKSGHFGRAQAFAKYLDLKRRFEPVKGDIVHAHLGIPTGWASAQIDEGRPLVVTEHQSTLASVLAEPPAAEAYGETIRRAGAFYCVSSHLRDQLARNLGDWIHERVGIMPNIVDLRDIPFRARDRYEFRSWIYVGGLVPHKGVELLLRSFETYREREDPDVTLTIVGRGSMERWIERFAISKGLMDSIEIVGAVPHSRLREFLDRADVMVHLSPAETFGIASLEGIGAGLPVISLENGGAESAWGDLERICGVIIPSPSDPEVIASEIADLRDKPDRLDLMKARSVIEERFGPEVIGRRLIETYQELAA